MDHTDIAPTFARQTKHAETRRQQRGVRTEVLQLVLENFDCDHDAGAGVAAISVSRRRLLELQEVGAPAAAVDQAGRTVLLVGRDGAILTIINRPTWFARFHHGAERLGHRRRSRRGARR